MQSILVFAILLNWWILSGILYIRCEDFFVKMAYIKFKANKIRKIFFGGATFNFELLIFLTLSAAGLFRPVISPWFKYV